MNTTTQTSKAKSQNSPVADVSSQKKNPQRGTVDFEDRRPEAAFQRKVVKIVNASPQTVQMQKIQNIMNTPSRIKKPLQRAGTALPLQLVSDEAVKTARDACNADSASSVERYSKGWKRKANATKKRIFETVHANESKWHNNIDHIMKGEASTPPAGYHSKALAGASNAVGTGDKNPNNVGGKSIYKQWTKRRGQEGSGNLKISTFFPDNWDEMKVRACALLSFTGASHHMMDQIPLDSPGDATFYPNSALENPDEPA